MRPWVPRPQPSLKTRLKRSAGRQTRTAQSGGVEGSADGGKRARIDANIQPLEVRMEFGARHCRSPDGCGPRGHMSSALTKGCDAFSRGAATVAEELAAFGEFTDVGKILQFAGIFTGRRFEVGCRRSICDSAVLTGPQPGDPVERSWHLLAESANSLVAVKQQDDFHVAHGLFQRWCRRRRAKPRASVATVSSSMFCSGSSRMSVRTGFGAHRRGQPSPSAGPWG